MKTIRDVCRDDILDRLEEDIATPPSRPDQRRRWAKMVIERVRFTDLAIKFLLDKNPELRPAWTKAVERAAEVWREREE